MTEEQNTVETVTVENNNIGTSPEVGNNNIPSEVANNTKTINLNNLRGAMEENSLVKRIVNKLVKNYDEITVTEIQELITSAEFQFSRWNVIKALKKLQDLGFLYFISGRKGRVSRVVWNISTRKLNSAVKDNVISEIEIASNKYNTEIPKVKRNLGTTFRHSFQLRPDMKINFSLPKNIQKEEITCLSTFITTLATTEEKVMT